MLLNTEIIWLLVHMCRPYDLWWRGQGVRAGVRVVVRVRAGVRVVVRVVMAVVRAVVSSCLLVHYLLLTTYFILSGTYY